MQAIKWLIAIALIITIADQFASGFMKPYFERYRPCHEPAIAAAVFTMDHCGGQYGFSSSHSANSFALAVYIWVLFRHRFAYAWLMFVWAAIVAYSRIHVGVHYPGDILVGAFVGIGSAHLVIGLMKWLKITSKHEFYAQ